MNRIGWQLALILFAGAGLSFRAEEARAEFILPGSEENCLSSSLFDQGGGTSSSSGEFPSSDSHWWLLDQNQDGRLMADSKASGNMSGTSSGGSVSAPSVAMVDRDESSPGVLVTYLVSQPGLSVPVPFLDGVFRPPRR